jgi:hypothetical protein
VTNLAGHPALLALAAELDPAPSREELLATFGGHDRSSLERLYDFCEVPDFVLERISLLAPAEPWGFRYRALETYLSEHASLAVEQGLFTWEQGQVTVRAGQLRTPAGRPIYLAFRRNLNPHGKPWWLKVATDSPIVDALPDEPQLPPFAQVDPDAKITLAAGHVLVDRAYRLDCLKNSNERPSDLIRAAASQACRAGSLVPHLFGGEARFYVPLEFEPGAGVQLVAAGSVGSERELHIHTVLQPAMAYPRARASVAKSEDLPGWLRRSWQAASAAAEQHRHWNLDRLSA